MKRTMAGVLAGVAVGASLMFAGGAVGRPAAAPVSPEYAELKAELESLRERLDEPDQIKKFISVRDRPGKRECGSLVFLVNDGNKVMLDTTGWSLWDNGFNNQRGYMGRWTK